MNNAACKEELYESADYALEEMDELLRHIQMHSAADTRKIWNIALVLDEFNEHLELDQSATLFRVNRDEDEFVITVTANAEAEKKSIERFIAQWRFIMQHMLSAPGQQLEALITLRPEERNEVLALGRTGDVQPAFNNITGFVERQAIATPDHIAVVYEDKKLTYEEVNRLADHLAGWLSTTKEVKSGDRVGVLMKRSEWIPVMLLGILKAGACYVPIDPAYPAHRINYILNDAKPVLVIAGAAESAATPDIPGDIQSLEELIGWLQEGHLPLSPAVVLPESLAYIIYTSGSTGEPKGVMIEHYNAAVFIEWALQEFATTPFAVTFAGTSYCFDLSVYEIFYTLSAGKTIRILDSSLQIPDYIQQEENILLNTVPSVIIELLHAGIAMDNVVAINMAGEPIPLFVKDSLDCDRMEVRNLYGPSEDTTYSTFHRIRNSDQDITIGKGIANTDIYILDDQLQLVPRGVAGEICISGDGLARGYLFREQLTQEKFIDNPLKPGTRLYRTGDLGKWKEDGNITYMGRRDHQVKIRGYRIELGEIETGLSACEGVKIALVMACRDDEGKQFLVAYVTGEGILDQAFLRNQLSDTLPDYMIPSVIIVLKAFPLTPNGKIDRKALPDPLQISGRNSAYEAPATAAEHVLTDIWQEVLQRKAIGVLDNFFEIGGDSLKATRIMYQIYKRLSLNVTLKQIFDSPTIRTLSGLLKEVGRKEFESIGKAPEAPLYEMSPVQKSIWIEDLMNDSALSTYNLPRAVFIDDIDPVLLDKAFRAMVERHESLRTNIVVADEQPWQKICPVELCQNRLSYEDMRGDIPNKDELLKKIAEEEAMRPFRLDSDPLIRARLVQVDERRFLFMINIHHIISDGWSLEIMVAELFGNYAMLKEKGAIRRDPLIIQYKDYVAWFYRHISADRLGSHLEYWVNNFRETPPSLNFSQGRPPEGRKSYEGKTISLLIDKPTTTRIHQLARNNGASLFMTLLSAVKAVLFRYTGREDIVIGSPVAGRDHPDTDELIGLFAHALPVRTKFSGDDTFLGLLGKVKESTMGAYEHQICPIERIIEELKVDRRVGRNALFDILVVLQNAEIQLKDGPSDHGVELQSYQINADVSQIDLMVNFTEETVGIQAEFQYNSDMFSAEWIEIFIAHFKNFIDFVVAQPAVPICVVPIFTTGEGERLRTFERTLQRQTLPRHFSLAVQQCLHQQDAQIRVADRFFQPLPVSVRGNVYITLPGEVTEHIDGLAATEPFTDETGQRWYLTSDMASWQPDGSLRYLGTATDNGTAAKRIVLESLRLMNDNAEAGDERIEALKQIWKEVLKHDNFSTTDNFFLVGGHSLKAFRMLAIIERNFQVKMKLLDIFYAPTIQQLATYIRKIDKKPLSAKIERVAEQSRYSADNRQMKIYTRIVFAKEPRPYNVTGAFALQQVNRQLFGETVGLLARKQEALRTTFVFEEGQLFQVVHPIADDLPVSYFDFSDQEDKEAQLQELYATYRDYMFDLHLPYLWKIALVRMSEELYTVILSIQHAIGDGGSLQLLSDDFNSIYEQLENHQEITIDDNALQLKDYCNWQNKRLTEEGDTLLAYWKEKLSANINWQLTDTPAPAQAKHYREEMDKEMQQHFVPLTGDQKNFIYGKVSTARPFRGHLYRAILPAQDWQELASVVATLNCGYFNFLGAALFIWLKQQAKADSLVIGAPVSYRQQEGLQSLMGYLVEIMLVNVQVKEGQTFRELVGSTVHAAQEAVEHLYPFEQLLDQLDLPLEQVGKMLLHLRNLDMTAAADFPDDKLGKHENDAAPQFQLNFKCDLFRNGLVINCEYWPELFSKAYVETFTDGYIKLLQQLIYNPDTLITNA